MENSLLLDVLDVARGVAVGISQNPVGLFSRHNAGDIGVEVDISYVNDSFVWEVDAYTEKHKGHLRISGRDVHPFVDLTDLASGFTGFQEASLIAGGQPQLYTVEHMITDSLLSVIYGRDANGFVFQVRLINGKYDEPLFKAHILNAF